MRKLKMAVIGTGLAWERLHYPAISKLKDEFEIIALCNKTSEKANDFADKIKLDKENVYTDYQCQQVKEQGLTNITIRDKFRKHLTFPKDANNRREHP